MALIVETGTGSEVAESLCSVDFADTYHAKRSNIAWDALDTTDQKEPALRKATDYIIQAYQARWKGYRVSATQALDWPRSEVYIDPVASVNIPVGWEYSNLVPSNIVPEPVKKACAELALKAATLELNPDLTQGVLQETVGPISVTYDKASPQRTRYAAIDAMLQPYLLSGGGISMRLVRV